jgi:hypothetical protein
MNALMQINACSYRNGRGNQSVQPIENRRPYRLLDCGLLKSP